jgi:predicted SpoU family rRNA methylase
MRILSSTITRYVLVIAVAAVLGGTAYAVADYVVEIRTQPESVMGPGYNPPPPHIPIS